MPLESITLQSSIYQAMFALYQWPSRAATVLQDPPDNMYRTSGYVRSDYRWSIFLPNPLASV